MPTKIITLRELPPSSRNHTSKYEAHFAAAKRRPGTYVALPSRNVGRPTVAKRGLRAVMRNRVLYVYAPTAKKRRGK